MYRYHSRVVGSAKGDVVAKLSMGELESRVMDVLWNSDDWLTPGDVHAVLKRRRPISYTTVMTVLVRLWKKDRLDRRRNGRAFEYHPVATREESGAQRMREILASAGDRSVALNQFLQSLSPGDRARVRRILDQRGRR